MDGGRGAGGHGKGKKNKLAKKKAAAAALAAQAANSHKKPAGAHHGAKKVGASHSNVQVVAVSKAPVTHTAHHSAGEAAEQSMTRSKRKRLKKHAVGAANSLLKKHPEAKKLPSAASPKTAKPANVVGAAAAKPHVVSLVGKKKRKMQAAASTDEEGATKTSLKKGLVKDGKKSLKTKKKVVAVGNSLGTSEAMKSVASPKRKIAQVGSSVHKPQMQTSAGAASPKNETTTTSLKIVKKIKSKSGGVITKPVATAAPVTTVILEGKPDASDKERETQKDVTKPAVVIKLAQSTPPPVQPTKLRAVTQTPDAMQAEKASPVPEAPLASKQKMITLPEKSERVKTNNLTETAPAADAVHTRSDNNDKPISPTLKPRKTLTGVAETSASASDKKNASPVSEATCATTAAKPPVPSAADAVSIVRPRTPATDSTELLPSLVSNETVSKQESGLKRQRSTEPVSTSSNSNSLELPAKRRAVSSKVVATLLKPASQIGSHSQASSSGKISTDRVMPADNRPQPVGDVKDKQLPAKSAAVVVAQTEPSNPAPASQATGSVPENRGTRRMQSVEAAIIKSTAQKQIRSAQTQASAAEVAQPAIKTLKTTVRTEVSVTQAKDQVLNHPRTGISTDSAPKAMKMGIIMDSHAYVKKMMKCESATNVPDTRRSQSVNLAGALPPRPQNAWGASFGMVPPPAHGPSTPSRTLTTTPLSSWFLSKGCANFVKEVHFSDDDAGSSDDDAVSIGQSSFTTEKASPRRKASVVKKNSFLESLTTQSNWRSWYGNVDMHNLLDPPLAHVSEMLRCHEVTPLALPETDLISSGIGKKTDELGMLEADIRREKQRGLAFSEQLLMMLQGKTVSGKVLEEEYRPLLNH